MAMPKADRVELDRDRIAAAALRVADARGAAGFTMRAVAEELGVTPMALYHHVADKAALVALVVDAAVRERPMPAPTGSWQDDLWEVARWMRDSLRAHPALIRLRSTYAVWTPSILPLTERWMSVWQQSGLDLEDAVRAAQASSIAIIGAAEVEAGVTGVDLPDPDALALHPGARLLLTGEVDPDEQFELVVRSVVAGVHARLAGLEEHTAPG
jgi:AcrR family transcriptional regulator